MYCQYRRTVTNVPTRLHINLLLSHTLLLRPLPSSPRSPHEAAALQDEKGEEEGGRDRDFGRWLLVSP